MKSKFLICFVLISAINSGYSQTYDLINEIFQPKSQDTTYLANMFMSYQNPSLNKIFEEATLRYLWNPLPIKDNEMPSIEPFLEQFNLPILIKEYKKDNKDIPINPELLHISFKLITKTKVDSIRAMVKNEGINDYRKYLKKGFISLTKPIFNSSNEWAFIITESYNPYLHIAGGGMLRVYRKINNKWELYHTVTLWFV